MTGARPPGAALTNIQPLFARVLLEREKKEKQGGIIIPEEAQKRHATLRCKVLAIGPACDPSIVPGITVLIGRHAGDWINIDGKPIAGADDAEFFIAQDEDVLAVIT